MYIGINSSEWKRYPEINFCSENCERTILSRQQFPQFKVSQHSDIFKHETITAVYYLSVVCKSEIQTVGRQEVAVFY